jgi:hypothetical protein
LGVFAVMYYSVASRINEIGIRMALGACAKDMTSLVLGRGIRLALAGIALGALGALWTSYAIAEMLYQVRPSDPASFAGAALILTLVALLACYVPRAARIAHRSHDGAAAKLIIRWWLPGYPCPLCFQILLPRFPNRFTRNVSTATKRQNSVG